MQKLFYLLGVGTIPENCVSLSGRDHSANTRSDAEDPQQIHLDPVSQSETTKKNTS